MVIVVTQTDVNSTMESSTIILGIILGLGGGGIGWRGQGRWRSIKESSGRGGKQKGLAETQGRG